MSRFFEKDKWLDIVQLNNVPTSSGFFPYPALYLPINSETEGINGIKTDGGIISGTWSPGDAQYGGGKWETATSGSVNPNEDHEYYVRFSSTSDVDSSKGIVCMWYTPEYDSGDLSEDKYLVESYGFLDFYYDYANTRFIGRAFDGTSFANKIVSGTSRDIVSGTNYHVALSYNKEEGLVLYVDAVLDGIVNTTWTEQTLPAVVSFGCISGTGNPADGFIDDIRWYKRQLTSADLNIIKNVDYSLN